MPSIADGANASGTFGYQDSLSVQAGDGYARFECPVGTVVAEFRGSRTFGPYDSLTWKVTSLKGALYYEGADGTINYYSGGRDITSSVSGYGLQSSGSWVKAIPTARVNVNGTGALQMDARNKAGTVTTAVFSGSYTSAVNSIDWPYPGDDASEVRFTFPNTLTVEVI